MEALTEAQKQQQREKIVSKAEELNTLFQEDAGLEQSTLKLPHLVRLKEIVDSIEAKTYKLIDTRNKQSFSRHKKDAKDKAAV